MVYRPTSETWPEHIAPPTPTYTGNLGRPPPSSSWRTGMERDRRLRDRSQPVPALSFTNLRGRVAQAKISVINVPSHMRSPTHELLLLYHLDTGGLIEDLEKQLSATKKIPTKVLR